MTVMSGKRRRRNVPNWAGRQRQNDLAWIQENFFVIFPHAQAQFSKQGRGAIVVDTTVQPLPGAGHPLFYFSLMQVQQMGDLDALRMVREYTPNTEVVIVLLKHRGMVSTYRIQEMQIPPPSRVAPN